MISRILSSPVSIALLAALCATSALAQAPPQDAASLAKGLTLRSIGPAFMSGRISDVEVHPTDRSTWYLAAGSGGVWKTTNAGTTFTPVFDDEPSYSIGEITIDPTRPQTVWVGTGENVSGRHVGWGDGIYRMFQLYLWGGHHCVRYDTLQAYRMLIRRPGARTPRWS